MSDPNNDAVDRLLREQFEGPVPDDGFSADMMQRLPGRRARQVWPLVLGIGAGGGVCWGSLLFTPFLHNAWSGLSAGEVSAPALIVLAAMAGMSLLAMAWAASESGAC